MTQGLTQKKHTSEYSTIAPLDLVHTIPGCENKSEEAETNQTEANNMKNK